LYISYDVYNSLIKLVFLEREHSLFNLIFFIGVLHWSVFWRGLLPSQPTRRDLHQLPLPSKTLMETTTLMGVFIHTKWRQSWAKILLHIQQFLRWTPIRLTLRC